MNEERPIKICVCIPAYDQIPSLFAFDLASLMTYTTATLVNQGIASLGIKIRVGTYAHDARQTLAAECLDEGYDYVFFLDSDMRFPKDALIRLLAHDKPIVGCNYATRGSNRFVAIKTLVTEVDEGETGRQLRTGEDSTGLEEAAAIGFGCVLIKTTVFQDMLDDLPWFFFKWVEHNGERHHTGEDVYFCQKARKHGWKILVDHDLSKKLGHIGQFEYDVLQIDRLKQDFHPGVGGDDVKAILEREKELELVE